MEMKQKYVFLFYKWCDVKDIRKIKIVCFSYKVTVEINIGICINAFQKEADLRALMRLGKYASIAPVEIPDPLGGLAPTKLDFFR